MGPAVQQPGRGAGSGRSHGGGPQHRCCSLDPTILSELAVRHAFRCQAHPDSGSRPSVSDSSLPLPGSISRVSYASLSLLKRISENPVPLTIMQGLSAASRCGRTGRFWRRAALTPSSRWWTCAPGACCRASRCGLYAVLLLCRRQWQCSLRGCGTEVEHEACSAETDQLKLARRLYCWLADIEPGAAE